MTFEIDVNGRSRVVSVERSAPGCFRVVLDGLPIGVNAARIGEHGLSLLLGDGQAASHDVHVAPGAVAGEVLVALAGRTAILSVNGRRSRRRAADAGGGAHGQQTIVAPMPGRVVRVLVAPGDEVAARQPVVVIEAMKMENELRAMRPGRVREVMVAAGASVEAGRTLAVLE